MGKMQNRQNKTVTVYVKGVDEVAKDRADNIAKQQGLNSMQDAVRMFIQMYAAGQIDLRLRFRLDQAAQEYINGHFIEIKPDEDIHSRLLNN